MNRDRLDLRHKPLEYLLSNVPVCSKHLTIQMIGNPEKNRLLPTEFGE